MKAVNELILDSIYMYYSLLSYYIMDDDDLSLCARMRPFVSLSYTVTAELKVNIHRISTTVNGVVVAKCVKNDLF